MASANTQSSNPVSFVFWLAVDIIIVILMVMLILRYYHGDLFFRLLEGYVVIFGSFFLFSILINDILPTISLIPLSVLSLLLAIFLLAIKGRYNNPAMRNLITMITSIGAGVFIGISIGVSFGFLILYLLIAAFAIYDYLAVFVLKFMIPLAKEASNRNLAFMIGSSDMELVPGNKKQRMKEVEISKIKNPEIKAMVKRGSVPVVSSVMLGNGDIILPMTLAVGAYAIYASAFMSIMIIAGAGVGLVVTILLLRRYKVGLPAIPPLFAFISIALAIFSLISKPFEILNAAIFATASLLSIIAMLFTLRKVGRSRFAS